MVDRVPPAALAHQVAELVTVALAELSMARRTPVSDIEFKIAVERAETALSQIREPLQLLTEELNPYSNQGHP